MSGRTHFTLESSISLSAQIRQYTVYPEDPVGLTLFDPDSYSDLIEIQDQTLKKLLHCVGERFEIQHWNGFLNSHHRYVFTPELSAETVETAPPEVLNETEINWRYATYRPERPDTTDQDVATIFAFVQKAILQQTQGQWTLALSDVVQLTVDKAADNQSEPIPLEAYTLRVKISKSMQETATHAGLKFKKYATSTPPGTVAYHVGVAQHKE